MKQQLKCCNIIIILFVLSLTACVTGKKQYDTGMQLKQAGNYREAITSLEEAIALEPNNAKYQQALSEVKDALIRDLLTEAEAYLLSVTPVNITSINRAKSILSECKEIDASHPAANEFSARLQEEEQVLLKSVREYYDKAKKNIESGEWLGAYSSIQQIQRLFPDYEDSKEMMQKVSSEGAEELHAKGQHSFDREDYRSASEYLRQALTLNPDYIPSQTLLESANERNSKEYFEEQAKKEVTTQNWARAIELYEKAQTYDPADKTLKNAVVDVKTRAVYYFMQEARSHMYAGWIGKALNAYNLIDKYRKGLNMYEFGDSIKGLTTELLAKFVEIADGFSNQGNYGSAWFWYQETKNIDSGYPNIFYRVQAMEDKVIEKIKKSIAVFDFESPSSAPDAGSIFANNLNTFLFKTADPDIKILERENLKSILEEMKLGQVGVVSSETAQEMGRVYGIDVAVMGSVLRYNVDSTGHSDTKSVTYQVEETEENIDYLNWKALNPNPTKEDLKKAPTPYIQKMKDVEKEYNFSVHKKVAFVTVSFRVVDVKTGENISVDTISRNKTATDETSAGVEVAGIKFDPLEIPTDTELLQELTNGVITELGHAALNPLKELEKKYYDSGEFFLTRRDNTQAAEYFVYSIFDQKLKGIQDSPLIQDANKHLGTIFQDYKIQLNPPAISLSDNP